MTTTDDVRMYSLAELRQEISNARQEWEGRKPQNVIQAIAAVIRDLPGIGKDDRSEQGYNYRGIESVTREAQILFGKHCVVYTPRVLQRNVVQITKNNKPWTRDELEVVYDVYGPGGPEDHIVVGPVWGIGDDNSDKGANKGATQAFKYALLQTLCIGDRKDDGDQGTPETDYSRPLWNPEATILPWVKRLNADELAELKDWRKRAGLPPMGDMTPEQGADVLVEVGAIQARHRLAGPPAESQDAAQLPGEAVIRTAQEMQVELDRVIADGDKARRAHLDDLAAEAARPDLEADARRKAEYAVIVGKLSQEQVVETLANYGVPVTDSSKMTWKVQQDRLIAEMLAQGVAKK